MAIKHMCRWDKHEWHRWFAWRPVYDKMAKLGPNYYFDRYWWIWVERRRIYVGWVGPMWRYRVPEDPK